MTKTWFITGASRGFGAEFVKAALAAGDNVLAAARNMAGLESALGAQTEKLAFAACDVTDPAQVRAAVALAMARFGGISVLVNNAGYGHFGVFEEMTPADVAAQFAPNIHGVFNVTWAVLPIMRAARAGHIFNISSMAGLRGSPGGALYAASKHAIEGWAEGLAGEVAPFGIHVTLVEPGFFRTEFLSGDSMRQSSTGLADYAGVVAQRRAYFAARHGQQEGDPAKLAAALVTLANADNPPLRFLAGTDALAVAEEKIARLRHDADAWRGLSASLGYDAP